MNSLRAGSSVLRYAVSNLRVCQTSAVFSGVKRQPQRAMSNNSEHDDRPQPPPVQDEQNIDTTVSNENEQSSDQAEASSEIVKAEAADSEELVFSEELEKEREWVEMWNNDAPAGPEWGGPRNYEPTRYGDWARNGRVTDF